MKLYGAATSPFTERVRLALAYKGLPCETVLMTGQEVRGPAWREVNPTGKIPLLVTDDSLQIPESETILDYLDDAFPDPPLRPGSPAERARMRTVIRIHENYVAPPLFRLFEQIPPATRKADVVADEIGRWRRGLALLAPHVDDAPYAVGGRFSLADCVLFPGLMLCELIARMFDAGDVLGAEPRLAAYYVKAKGDPLLGQSYAATQAARAAAAH
jgi:glutathione S-transferase